MAERFAKVNEQEITEYIFTGSLWTLAQEELALPPASTGYYY